MYNFFINGEEYVFQKILGKGSYGITFLYIKNDKNYAVKFLNCQINFEREKYNMIEIKKLLNGCDERIQCYVDCFTLNKNDMLYNDIYQLINIYNKNFKNGENIMALISEFIDGDELYNYIIDKKRTLDDINNFVIFMMEVLYIIHSKNIIHNDIKPENIIRKKNGKYVLIDFGLSSLSICDKIYGSNEYIQPWLYSTIKKKNTIELHKEHDIFGFMMTLYSLVNCSYCFEINSPIINYNTYIPSKSKYKDYDNFLNYIFKNKLFKYDELLQFFDIDIK